VKKILIVEDDENIARSLDIRLQAAGYETRKAANGVDGLRLAQDLKPDLAILDMRLPVASGESVAYRMRESAPEVPFIFLTARNDPAARQAAERLGAAAFFEKPFDTAALMAGVARILNEKGPAKARVAGTVPRPAEASTGKKLLIVEDDLKIALALAIRFKSAGYQVMTAHDAMMGVSAAVKDPPDLVILDISMPAGNGFDVAERIQALMPNHTAIIFLTASKDPGLREKAVEIGAAGFFEKPYDAEKLLAAIKRSLARS